MAPPTRPATISELAAAAAESPPPPGRELKQYLRLAESHRKAGASLMARATGTGGGGAGGSGPETVALDMERGFIEFARAATLIVETIPAHRDYATELNGEQKANLTANGHELLQNLGKLKAALVDRYERYARGPGASGEAVPAFRAAAQQQQQREPQAQAPTRRASQAVHVAAQLTADEAARWRAQREEAARRDAAAGYGPDHATRGMGGEAQSHYRSSASGAAYGGSSSSSSGGYGGGGSGNAQPTYLSSASQAAVAAATRAAAASQPQLAVLPPSLGPSSAAQASGQLAPVPASFARPDSSSSKAYTYPSSAGVSFPQPQHVSPVSPASSSSYGPPSASSSYAPSPAQFPSPGRTANPNSTAGASYAHAPPSSRASSSQYQYPPTTTPYTAPGPMPLRAPHAHPSYEWDSESTDEERGPPHTHAHAHASSISYPHPGTGMPYPGSGPYRGANDLAGGMARLAMAAPGEGGPSRIDGLPSPSTSPSTSTSHRSAVVAYPALARHMSSHQRTQGYVPGAWGSSLPPAVPAFIVPPEDQQQQQQQQQNQNIAGVGASAWGQQAALGAARAAATAPPTTAVGYSTPFAPPADPRAAREAAQADAAKADRERSERDERAREEETRRNGGRVRLRTVLLPQVTLPRFLAIASGNTARNLETCGLLLGREVVRGSADPATAAPSSRTRYVVETLLIPKQHATSDTCTMDEEEGVLGFTEERGLITLGWIHTHPSQSCFMSSVDLHTHASFQCMLPESFAVLRHLPPHRSPGAADCLEMHCQAGVPPASGCTDIH
ncbi:hypothetical protein K438DRAFT_244351 [Mycena galopus ATCC 62051]|nr:hypothetical protein K438DRAFT_244351 [Mycena galopus ATCC 62051]